MKKALTFAALSSLALSSDFSQFSDDELNFIKNIGNGLKKAGEFVAHNPQIITTAIKILALEDELEDDHFTMLGLGFLKDIIGLKKLKSMLKDALHHDDVDDVDNELAFVLPPNYRKPITPPPNPNVIKGYIKFDDEYEEEIADEFLAAIIPKMIKLEPVSGVPDTRKGLIRFEDEDNELANLGELIKDGIGLAQASEIKNMRGIIDLGLKLAKDRTKKDSFLGL